jgi:hypothetical protein
MSLSTDIATPYAGDTLPRKRSEPGVQPLLHKGYSLFVRSVDEL